MKLTTVALNVLILVKWFQFGSGKGVSLLSNKGNSVSTSASLQKPFLIKRKIPVFYQRIISTDHKELRPRVYVS